MKCDVGLWTELKKAVGFVRFKLKQIISYEER